MSDNDWINDRLPSPIDGDENGFVVLNLGNGAWKYVQWQHVTEDDLWKPIPALEPTTLTIRTAPKPRKLTAIASGSDIVVLCADHTLWRFVETEQQWQQLPPIPGAQS